MQIMSPARVRRNLRRPNVMLAAESAGILVLNDGYKTVVAHLANRLRQDSSTLSRRHPDFAYPNTIVANRHLPPDSDAVGFRASAKSPRALSACPYAAAICPISRALRTWRLNVVSPARSSSHAENSSPALRAPKRSISTPDSHAPTGMKPKASRRNVLLTRPCNSSGMIDRR